MKNLNNEELFTLMKDIFKFYHGRIPKPEQILLWYPDYLQTFFSAQRTLMVEEGSLPLDWRYYLAILVSHKGNKLISQAVACYGCEYLYYLLVEGFIEAGGEVNWLTNPSESLPDLLKPFIDITYEFAYNPWIFYKGKSKTFVSKISEHNVIGIA